MAFEFLQYEKNDRVGRAVTASFRSVLLSILLTHSAIAAESDRRADYDWPSYGMTKQMTKYADLDQINRHNVADLQIAWTWEPPDGALLEAIGSKPGTNFFQAIASSGFKSTPIKIGDTLYVSTPMGYAAAIDAATGKKKWIFDTRTYDDGRPANIGFNHRGVSYFEEGEKRRILMGTNNAYLWSLDADTGVPDPHFGQAGRVDLTKGLGQEIDRSKYSNTVAVMIIDNTVVMGAVISDMPVVGWHPKKQSEMPPGHIRGFDVHTGQQKWIFHSIPKPGETGHDTWEDDSWKVTGSTNVWTLMTGDPVLGYVYLPFGAPSNDWYGGQRLGDNLFGNSIVCLKASTGELVWYFQTVHHDLWDYDLPAPPVLADITVDGQDIKAIAQVSKQAFVYVLDRVTGKPVWPIVERPVPSSNVPGERTATTQPVPTKPAPFDRQGLDDDDLIDFTPELKAEAKAIVSKFRNEGFFTPPSLEGSLQLPGDGGGAEWNSAAFDPETSLLFVSSATNTIVSTLVGQEPEVTEYRYLRGGTRSVRGPRGLPLTKPPYSRISAIDLNTGDYAWVVPNGDGMRQRVIDMGIPDPGPLGGRGHVSPMVTKSLLFVTGYSNRPVLRAMDKVTGETIHEIALPGYAAGVPMTYTVNGKQYIVVAVVLSGRESKLIALSLPTLTH
ncbi:MAG: pyrroloquinoline quinone-dependent dehydrogenase [Pseudomonadales bacterium]|nr:pyrroloquinoline quinone-dependent dehydrogenase [Pseudomonadales bacterium]MDP7357400.1 pyrroloquinoline quinone-dependent dehydrogenase [Pseudomonadales bacterium]MDP7595528.1 pyrroloquinoline quinone-dependent dehydrogenase [Pseudomonadales bacterium]HJN49519.1 pyrroloquinoline quinone-dependent dehydrogenase [Pseudomonadales bacterium]